MTAHRYATPTLCDHFERQCNRFVNGGCMTLRCVQRGRAADPGRAPMMSMGQLSTCEAFETAHIIADQIGRVYGPDYDMGTESSSIARADGEKEARALGRLIAGPQQ